MHTFWCLQHWLAVCLFFQDVPTLPEHLVCRPSLLVFFDHYAKKSDLEKITSYRLGKTVVQLHIERHLPCFINTWSQKKFVEAPYNYILKTSPMFYKHWNQKKFVEAPIFHLCSPRQCRHGGRCIPAPRAWPGHRRRHGKASAGRVVHFSGERLYISMNVFICHKLLVTGMKGWMGVIRLTSLMIT